MACVRLRCAPTPAGRVCAQVYSGSLPTAVGLLAVLIYFRVPVAPCRALGFLPAPWRTGARPLGLAGLGGRVRTLAPLAAELCWSISLRPLRPYRRCFFCLPIGARGRAKGDCAIPLCNPWHSPLSGPTAPLADPAGLGARYRRVPNAAITGSASCLAAPPTVAASARQRGAQPRKPARWNTRVGDCFLPRRLERKRGSNSEQGVKNSPFDLLWVF